MMQASFNTVPTFKTKRLFIRPPKEGDGQALFESLQTSQNELAPWLTWVQQFKHAGEAEEGVRQAYRDFMQLKDLRFHLFELESGSFIGSAGLHEIKWTVPRMEIGYWLDSRYTGKGYMVEAVQQLISFAFYTLQAHRLEIRCDPKNEKSRAIAEKLHFQLEAVLIENERCTYGPGFADTCVYSLMASAFKTT